MAALVPVRLRKQRTFRISRHLDDLSEDEMRLRYRFGHRAIQYLVDLLRPQLERDTERNQALSVWHQLLMALRFYASGNFLQVIGDTLGFDKSTVSRTIGNVTDALMGHLADFIKWPTREQVQTIKRGFYRMRGMPNIIGCIDGCHVRIQGPSEDEASYVNRKGYHSINVQAVCDHEGRFISFCASWPGSTHDSHVFRTSRLRLNLEQNHRILSDGVLLGDSGYPCRPFLLTPFLLADTPNKQRYQRAHTVTRCTIERTFGRWKRRFHVLHSEVRMEPSKVCRIATACAILHNISLMFGEPDIDVEVDEGIQEVPYDGNRRDGHGVRDHYVNAYFHH